MSKKLQTLNLLTPDDSTTKPGKDLFPKWTNEHTFTRTMKGPFVPLTTASTPVKTVPKGHYATHQKFLEAPNHRQALVEPQVFTPPVRYFKEVQYPHAFNTSTHWKLPFNTKKETHRFDDIGKDPWNN
jgi:hypothetical protein